MNTLSSQPDPTRDQTQDDLADQPVTSNVNSATDQLSDPAKTSLAPSSAMDTKKPDVEVDYKPVYWWLTEKCKLAEEYARNFLDDVTNSGKQKITARRFILMYKNIYSNEIKEGTFPVINNINDILNAYADEHPEPVTSAPSTTPSSGSPVAPSTPPAPVAPDSAVPDSSAATPDSFPTATTTASPDTSSTTTATATGPTSSPVKPSSTPAAAVIPPAPVAPTSSARLVRKTAIAISAAAGLAVAGISLWGLSKAEDYNGSDQETNAPDATTLADASAKQAFTPPPLTSSSASSSTSPNPYRRTPPSIPSQPSSIDNSSKTIWVRCDNELIPTNCQLPSDCQQLKTSLSQKVRIICGQGHNKVEFATPNSAEATYPHGKNVYLQFEKLSK